MFRAFNAWRRQEFGFSIGVMFLLGMPVLIGGFGLAFDTARVVYVKSYLQGRADIAVQAAVGQAYSSGGKITLGDPSKGGALVSLATARSVYLANTESKRLNDDSTVGFLTSPHGSYGVPIATVVGKPLLPSQLCTAPTAGVFYGVKMTVQEQVPSAFLQILGIKNLNVKIVSQGLVHGKNC